MTNGTRIEDFYKLIEACSYRITTNLDYLREEIKQELTLVALEKMASESFQQSENKFGLMKKVLHDWGVNHTRKQINKTDLCIFDKAIEDTLKEKLFQGACEYRGDVQETPEAFAEANFLEERILAYASSIGGNFQLFVTNLIDPSPELHDMFNAEAESLKQMNRSTIPPMTIGRLIGLKKKETHNFIVKLREFTTNELQHSFA